MVLTGVLEQCAASTNDREQRAVQQLRHLHDFAGVPDEELACLVHEAQDQHMAAGTVIVEERQPFEALLVLLDGRVRVTKSDAAGNPLTSKTVTAPSFMGEVPLLTGSPSWKRVVTETETDGLRVEREAFWGLMARCPQLRAAIITETTTRVRGMQALQSQQDKMAMLGTLTAGLMHELNNPGSAARRAAVQLRGNLERMHKLARSFSEHGHTEVQRACLSSLQERVLATRNDVCLSSLQQTDAEEAMGEWLDAHNVARAWEIAPALVSSGLQPAELDCLAAVFSGAELSQPLEWLEATASSMQMVGLVEDSVTRVAELAQAVKSYAHEGQGSVQDVDINSSIHATLVMLKHKLREKGVALNKDFGGGIPQMHCACSGLNQVWTNLLDNAIDAVPANGHIGVATSVHDDEIRISIRDNGPGISPENLDRIFDPFFTTKAAGKGSGLGLGIVQRILENYKGHLTVQSAPGNTEFVVHLPAGAGQ